MSFGTSLGDIIALSKLVKRTYDGWKDACGDYASFTGDLASLHAIMTRVESERQTRSSIFASNSDDLQGWKLVSKECYAVVSELKGILTKYKSLGSRQRRNWDRIRMGNHNFDQLHKRLAVKTANLSSYLIVLGVSSQGRIENSILPQLLQKVDDIAVQLRRGTGSTMSGMTAYPDDDRAVWREFRRDLIRSGVRSSDLKRNSAGIQTHIHRLRRDGKFEEDVPQLPEPSVDFYDGVEDSNPSRAILPLEVKTENEVVIKQDDTGKPDKGSCYVARSYGADHQGQEKPSVPSYKHASVQNTTKDEEKETSCEQASAVVDPSDSDKFESSGTMPTSLVMSQGFVAQRTSLRPTTVAVSEAPPASQSLDNTNSGGHSTLIDPKRSDEPPVKRCTRAMHEARKEARRRAREYLVQETSKTPVITTQTESLENEVEELDGRELQDENKKHNDEKIPSEISRGKLDPTKSYPLEKGPYIALEGWCCQLTNAKRRIYIDLHAQAGEKRCFLRPPVEDQKTYPVLGWDKIANIFGRVYWRHQASNLISYAYPLHVPQFRIDASGILMLSQVKYGARTYVPWKEVDLGKFELDDELVACRISEPVWHNSIYDQA